MKIFLDDERVPVEDGWRVVRTVDDFITLIHRMNELVVEISFDHDLADEMDRSATYCINEMIQMELDKADAFPRLQNVILHTANYAGLKNMAADWACAKKAGMFKGVKIKEYSCLYHTDHAVMPLDFERDENE